MACKNIALPDAVAALVPFGATPSYNQLWSAAVTARIPAHRIGRKWIIKEDDLPTIAQAFLAGVR